MEYLKERWQKMDWGRRIILLIQPVMFLLFLILFLTFGQQQVVPYGFGYLRYEQQGDTAVYSGLVDYRSVKYTVSPGPVVEYWLDGTRNSTYTLTEDPTAIPRTEETAGFDDVFLIGVEIRKGNEVWFRGAYSPYTSFFLFDENGNDMAISITFSPETSVPEPTPNDILRFAQGPETSRRGEGIFMFIGFVVGVCCLVSLLFEDQLFRWHLSFRVAYPDDAEPSEWELFGRWVGWIAMTVLALVIYAMASGLHPMPMS